MKKLVTIIALSLTLSNATLANVVPCNEPKCNKKDHSTLTRFIEATEKNNKPILVWLSGGSGQYLSTQPLSEVEGKYDLVIMFNPYDISRNSQNRSDGYAPVAYKPDQADSCLLYTSPSPRD